MFFTVTALSLLSTKQKVVSFLIEFSFIVIPVILNVTILTEYLKDIVYALSLVIGFMLFLVLNKPLVKNKAQVRSSHTRNYITNARSTINLISVIAILAVDFQTFPSRFSKTQTTGFSLMDVGVGLFIYSNGIVAPEAKERPDSIKKSLKSCITLTTLGIIRLILTRITAYHVSEVEYGLHWNFFITLAVTKLFTSIILNVVSIKYIYASAIFLTFTHEVFLETIFKKFVFGDIVRDNFISANREGLVSSIGYITLYLYSVYFGYFIYHKERSKFNTHLKLFVCSAACLSLTLIFDYLFGVSRRVASSGYIFWVLFIGVFMTWLFYLAENLQTFFFTRRLTFYLCSPIIFEAINYNGLIFFLLANILTGLINKLLNTKSYGPISSLLIISFYMLLNCMVVFILYTKQIKIKF
ncbi:uncharacterized protein LOC132697409 isoform X2 [Cylas formicarius]|nr:uncharacterized protein LOC132697409 isoform X2 [Cylas formicarius]XP_060518886.1 uncharacterized protein LOC132697409 isoform X2 [Cylas formicarius]XP_060518887.1 uncharacterized protein LOC132697409 isoform X2 [Cylas formicarius]XP_060518888.1 uncharacterized protein LOC132697409 isoform X2 [Cylas formicarius]